jgi:hypothetical protein
VRPVRRVGWAAAAAVLVLATTLGAGDVRADIQNWPLADSDWHAIMAGGDFYSDPVGDINPDWLDIVGDTTVFSAGYWAYSNAGTPGDKTDDEIMWRIRLEEEKTNPNVVWQVFMDTDGDDLVDWSMQVDASGSNVVELVAATVGGTTFGDVTLDAVGAWSGSLAGFSRFVTPTGDGSGFGGAGPDTFLDFGMPWLTFSSITGVTGSGPVRFGLSSSASHVGINKDLPFSLTSTDLVGSGLSDPIIGLPEPSTFSLLAGGLLILGWRGRRSRIA